MSSIANDILDQVISDLEGIDGSPDYTHALGEGRVIVGEPVSADAVPRLYLTDTRLAARDDDELGGFRRTLEIEFLGYVGATSDSGRARLQAAISMYDDVCRALEADRTVGGRVVRMVVQAQAFSGSQINLHGLGVVEGLIELEYIASGGEGA